MQPFIKFMRFTLQGVSIASFGTMGLTPSWGAFIVGMGTFLAALAFLTFEKGD